MAASTVTKRDIATLSDDIVAGRYPGSKASVANARHMRRAASGLFNWAAEAGREYVTASHVEISRQFDMDAHWPLGARGGANALPN